MKRLYFLLIICFLLLAGCSDNSPVMSDYNNIEKTVITFPAEGLSVENSLFASAGINGSQGGELLLQGSFQAYVNKTVTINSKLTVPPGAYSGTLNIIQVNEQGAYSDFGPAKIFNQPLLLDYTITGLELTGSDPASFNFYYLAPDGSMELTQNDGVFIDVPTGTLKVIRARINHFSRYGWAK